ncbi:MAG TPA: glycoside hydrolase family 3 C-terminal domain-containing protein [Mucilaginibacter sp.]|jgi:beta-glucosidase
MKKKFRELNTLVLVFVISNLCVADLQAQQKYPFQNPKLQIEKRVDNLISLLTMDEKISLLQGQPITRLGVKWPGSAESIHQVKLYNAPTDKVKVFHTTSFSQVAGMSETWNPDLIKQAGAVMGYEARYLTQNKNYERSTLILWGPTSDLARDPRWGRTDESFGEDPFLTGTMAVNLIKGMQGDDPTYWQAASLMKHVFANSNETTRTRSSSDFDDRLMREYYSVPFRMGFTQGGAKSFMASYNAWNGIPMTVNPVLKKVVGNEWGANWIISSDAGAIEGVVNGHKYLKTIPESFAAAIKVGMNQFLTFGISPADTIKKCLNNGLLTEADVNAALRGKIKTIIKLGLLDPSELNPYSKIGAGDEPEPWNSEKHKGVARNIALQSVVLLKNDNNILPLNKAAKKSIAIIGPRAATVLNDFYGSPTPYSISVLQAIKDKVGGDVTITTAVDNDYNAAVKAAKTSDIAIVVIGNDPMCGTVNLFEAFNRDGSTKPCPECGDGREGRDRQSIDIPSEDLVKEVYAANPNTIVVLISSFPYAINWTQSHVPAILHITHTGQEQGTAIASVLFGEYNPAGRLIQTWPKSLDQLPPMLDYNIRDGHTYLYSKETPLYPFGYGLSYSKFSYSGINTSTESMGKKGSVTVTFDVKNTGSRDGDEVVQLYVQYPQSKIVRPIKELKGFQRLNIKTGETKTVTLTLKAEALSWWNEAKNAWEVESGPIKLLIGSSSWDIKLEKQLMVN